MLFKKTELVHFTYIFVFVFAVSLPNYSLNNICILGKPNKSLILLAHFSLFSFRHALNSTSQRNPLEDTTASDFHHKSGVVVNLNQLQIDPNNTQAFRRRSEGDANKRPIVTVLPISSFKPNQPKITAVKPPTHPVTIPSTSSDRRISLDSGDSHHEPTADLIKCRLPKCDASATPTDAKNTFKSCHNCTHMYCSRECRRAHWDKHRRACLHSRVSALCRQVLSACKDDESTLLHLSILARKGFGQQGRGVVRLLFRSPESAENFVRLGFQSIGEVSYVRWPELQPQEMGAELYSELLRLSTEYKTETKMLIYVAICVVSEAPSSATTAGVKWERQLVSRCAKLKLSKSVSVINQSKEEHSSSADTIKATLVNSDTISTDSIDVLILTFYSNAKPINGSGPEQRSLIQQNIVKALRRRGVSLRRHFPEVFQRLNSFVEGTADRLLPVTIHPRDAITGRPFICIIMPRETSTEDDVQASLALLPKGLGANEHVEVVDCLNIAE